jgi:hypothetical protein
MSQFRTKAAVWGFCIQSSWSAFLYEWPEYTVIARKGPQFRGALGRWQDGQMKGSDKWAQRQYHCVASGKRFPWHHFLRQLRKWTTKRAELEMSVRCKVAVYVFITFTRMPWESHRNVTQEDRFRWHIWRHTNAPHRTVISIMFYCKKNISKP